MSDRIVVAPRPVRRRSALHAAIPFTLGIAAAAHFQSVWAWCVALPVFAGILALLLPHRTGTAQVFVVTLLFAAGAVRYVSLDRIDSPTDLSRDSLTRERCRIYGCVVSEPERRGERQVFLLALDSIEASPRALRRTGRVQVLLPGATPVAYGEYLELAGWLSSAASARNPGEFDYAAYLGRRDISARFHADRLSPQRVRRLRAGADLTGGLIIPLRRWVYSALNRHLSGEPADLLLGLLFGERRGLSPALENQFQNTGTLHLLAVSGSNVAVVMAVIWGTLGFLRIPSTLRRCLMLAALWVFSQLAYNEPSVVRAAVAAAVATLGLARRRRVDPINLWGGTLFILLLWEPRQLFEIGFQLSFLATLGILTGAPLFGRHPRGRGILRRALRSLLLALGVSISAQLAVIPILAGAFNQVPLVTPMSNLICVPLAGLATAAGLVAILAALLGGFAHAVCAAAAWLSVSLLIRAVAFFDALDFPQWLPSSPDLATSLLYYALLAGLRGFVVRRPIRRLMMFSLLLVGGVLIWISALRSPSQVEMVHFDLGARAGSVIHWSDRSVWLIAAGDRPSANVWRRTVTPLLKRRGWEEPQLLVSLDSDLDCDEVRSEWPRIRILPADSLWDPSRLPTVPPPFKVTVHGFGSARAEIWGVTLEARGWRFCWLRNHLAMSALTPEVGRETWMAVPGLPWDYSRYLDADPGLTLIEASRSDLHDLEAVQLSGNRVFRVLTSGAVVTSGTESRLVAEPSMR